MFNRKIVFHSAFKKDTEKVALLEVKGLIHIILKFMTEKKLCSFLSSDILFRGMKHRLRKQLCSFENGRLISFSYRTWVMISEKNIIRCTFVHRGACMYQKSQRGIQKILSALKLPLCGLVIFIDRNMNILTEGSRSLKTFMKENYAIAFNSCY